MSRIICIIGNKGGTGKTTLSHMLCQGLGLLGHRSACVLTDTSREPLTPDGRRYVTADARTPEALHKVVSKLRTMQGWIGVIDGGGNRTEVDRTLNGLADIVLLPFRESHEDLRTVLRDLQDFSHAYGLPSQWPTNAWARDAADRSVAQILGEQKHRLLLPVPSLSASKQLLQKSIPEGLPSNLGNACRALARQVLDILEVGDAASTPGASRERNEAAGSPPPTVLPEGYASTARH
ncbi:nucleotide-binding protein [Zoogloea dura]|jgi:chromosome partitioning protein|uniref:nucleotide-binding protein n=1 Tax=Zoogloea dura TaxID=2728840 RepID=UPI001F3A8B1B|nr:hypothetical protein [Zoogloea dura]